MRPSAKQAGADAAKEDAAGAAAAAAPAEASTSEVVSEVSLILFSSFGFGLLVGESSGTLISFRTSPGL